ncbi:hypothetical protein GCM10009668_37190 [Nocardioides dubius]|uniref:PknH-like extracellular domain-containing protein n=1 Tax=Nocardioides dubius TaxID=317019 RepID=A0ABN1U169_9ACTN
MSLPLRGLAGLATAGVLLLPLAACSDDDGTDSSGTDPSAATTPSSTPTSTPPATEEPTTSAPDATGSSDPSAAPPAEGLAAHLLPAESLPAVGSAAWTLASTEPDDGEPFGECAQVSLVDIGAMEAVVREFDAGEGVDAEQLVAEFADKKSAWRSHQVLKSWRTKCAANNADVAKVGPLATVPVSAGEAQTYLVTGKDPQEYQGVAINRVGTRISIVLIDVEGQAWPSDDPAAKAAVAAAPLL